jgi:hypothetical protein
MDISKRINELKKYEPKFGRTEFKNLFALATATIPLSEKELRNRTGFGSGRVKTATRSLLYHNVIIKTDSGYVYNDQLETWKLDLLNARVLYVTQPENAR